MIVVAKGDRKRKRNEGESPFCSCSCSLLVSISSSPHPLDHQPPDPPAPFPVRFRPRAHHHPTTVCLVALVAGSWWRCTRRCTRHAAGVGLRQGPAPRRVAYVVVLLRVQAEHTARAHSKCAPHGAGLNPLPRQPVPTAGVREFPACGDSGR